MIETGNNAAMRKALIKIYHEIRSYCYDYGAGESHKSLIDRIMDNPPDYTSYEKSILEIDSIVETALAAPARNCDAGTAEEQAKRFVEFCDEERGNRAHCRNCRLCNAKDCTLAWAQMPYEKEEESNG